MRRWLAGLCALVLMPTAAAAQGQPFGPVHEVIAIVGTATGGVDARPAWNRRLLVLINDSANIVYCTVSGVDAAANTGVKLAATGTTGDRHTFQSPHVPHGPVRCMSGTNGSRVLILEGR